MVLVFLSWIIISLVFLAFGDILFLLWNKLLKEEREYTIYDTFWVGLCTVSGICVLISLFLPISFFVLLFFLFFSIVILIVNRKRIICLFKAFCGELKETHISIKVALFLVLIIVGAWAVSYPYHYDNGLYHLQSMMWTEKYSVVPGLGNLHGRFAFNSSFLILTTLFSYHPDYYPIFYPLNSLCFLVFLAWLFSRLKKDSSFVKYLVILGLFVLVIVPYGHFLSGTSTDLLPNILVCYLLLSCFFETSFVGKRILPVAMITLFCITAKLSTIIIAIFLGYIIIQQIRQRNHKTVYIILFLCFMMMVPWFVRNVVQSGYLIYPFSAIDVFDFDWKIPKYLVDSEKDWISYYARVKANPEIVKSMSLFEWFPIWFENRDNRELRFFFFALISPIVLLFTYKSIKKVSHALFIWIIAVLGSAYCFFTAPDLRFSWGYFIVAGFIPCYLLFPNCKRCCKAYCQLIICSAFCLFFISHIYALGFRIKAAQEKIGTSYTLLLQPQPYDYEEKLLNPPFGSLEINNTTLYYPEYRDRCFDAHFPCLPLYESVKLLEMRGDNIQDGFRISEKK